MSIRPPFSSRLRALSVLSCLVALTACSEEPLLTDTDGGGPMPDAAAVDGGSDGGSPDGEVDAGSPDGGGDAGPTCESLEPGAPTDPASGAFLGQFANPGVGGGQPYVGAFAFGSDGAVYVGGRFSSAGYQSVSNVARWNGSTGWSALGAGLPTAVSSLAVGDDGSLYAAHADDDTGAEMQISRWDGSAWSTFAVADGTIAELAVVGTNLFAVGDFTTLGGGAHARLAYHDGTSWRSYADAADGYVATISATSPSDVCIGGSFTMIGTQSALGVACWNGTAWQGRGFPADLTFPRVFVAELERDPDGGALVAAGTFVLDETGTNDGNLARWNGTGWDAIGGGVSGAISGIAFASGELFVGGGFITINSSTAIEAHGAARWDGTAWHDMGGVYREGGIGFGGPVAVVAAGPEGSVYYGGMLTRAGTIGVGRVARWDGTYWQGMRTPSERYHGVGGSVSALASRGSCETYVGGDFRYAGGVLANGVASYTLEGGYRALGTGVAGAVYDLEVTSRGLVYAAGKFSDPETGTTFRNVAVWDGTTWRPVGDGVGAVPDDGDETVRAIAVAESSTGGPDLVYAGGEFTEAGGERATNLAQWDGTSWSDLGAGMTGHPYVFDPTQLAPARVTALVVDPATGDLIVAGSFSAIGAGAGRIETNNIARWDGEAWHAYDRGLGGIEGTVLALTLWNGRVVAAREFTGSEDSLRFARWNGTAWDAIGEGSPEGTPLSLDSAGDALFVAGNFSGQGHVAVYDGTTWSPLGTGASDSAQAISTTEGGVLVGGVFHRTGETSAAGIAFWQYAD